jgi:NAD(P)-dependent dehydrogenase (short-subunit alcohol dehydrogenase family)
MAFLQILLGIVTVVVGGVAVAKIYFKLVAGVCKSKRRIDGQVAIVTGSNSGIGFETAKDLARRGAKVILACRNVESAESACVEIRRETKNEKVVAKKLDLSSLASVRQFCKEILKEETRLDILVNNAGVAGLRKSITDEKLESQFATNHFGPFLMTNILIGLMKKTESGRIVTVSSLAHNWTDKLDLENLNSEKKWEPKVLYAKAKLCNILFTRELARRLKLAGLNNITANAVNPGGVKTAIFRHARKAFKYMIMVSQFFFKTPQEGAQPSIYLCVSEEVEGISGNYYADCKLEKSSKLAEDMELARGLWEKSAEIVNLAPEENHLK